jgi:FkbM family methyltransferase
MILKRLIKRATRSVGIEVSRYIPPKPQPQTIVNEGDRSPLSWGAGIWRWPAINALSLAVSAALFKHVRAGRDPSQFTIIQIGAFDGSAADPVRNYIETYGLKALLVEPQPDIFERLVKSYKGNPNVMFENAAISSNNGEAVLHRFKKSAGTPYMAGALASLSRETLIHNHHQMEGETEEVAIKLMTIESLMGKHGISSVDLLQVDTEGHDWDIIRSIDFAKVSPSIIHYEISILPERDQNASIELLASKGYSVLWYGTADLLALRQGKDDAPVVANWTGKPG